MRSVSPSVNVPAFESEKEIEVTSQAMSALASPARLRLLQLLQAKELAVVDLTRCLGGHTKSSVCQHLDALRKAGIVSRRKQGNRTLYRMDGARLAPVLNMISDVFFDQSERVAKALF